MAKRITTKQTKMVGMTESVDFDSLLTDGTESKCTSATAYTRLTFAWALNFEDALPENRPHKLSRKKPILKFIKSAIGV